MSMQRLVVALCASAAIVWVGSEAVRFYREEVEPETGLYWVLAGKTPLVVGVYPAHVTMPPGLNWSDFNRAVDAEARETVSYFRLRAREFEFDPRYVKSMLGRASAVAYFLRRDARAELYSLYKQDERDDRAAAWSKVSDRAVRAFAPALAFFVFAGAMWWGLAAFDEHGQSRAAARGLVRLWLVLSAAWVFSVAVLVPLLEPPGPYLVINAYGRRGCEPILLPWPRIDSDSEQETIAWVIGLLIVPVVLAPLLAAYDAARRRSNPVEMTR